MRIRTSLKWVLAVGVLAYAAAPVSAQTGSAQAGSAQAGGAVGAGAGGAAPTNGAPGTSAQVGFQRRTALTPQEQLTESQSHLMRMESASTGVRKMLAEARRQRDVVKTLCLNDKLSQVDVAIRSGRDRRTQLQSAVSRNDAEQANHEFTILTVLRQRVEQLVAESNQCIGEEAAFVGDTRVTTTVDPSIPPDEAPYPVTDPVVIQTPPQCVSCTL